MESQDSDHSLLALHALATARLRPTHPLDVGALYRQVIRASFRSGTR